MGSVISLKGTKGGRGGGGSIVLGPAQTGDGRLADLMTSLGGTWASGGWGEKVCVWGGGG